MAFGDMKEKNNEYNGYIGNYVIIFSGHSSSSLGQVKEVDDEWVILQPFVSSVYVAGEGLVKKLVEDKPARVRRSDVVAIEPTTRESLEGYCDYTNAEAKKKAEARKKKSEKSEDQPGDKQS